MRTLATNWEAEVASVRGENRGLRSSLEGAQVQQRQAEERARALEQRVKEADDLKAALDAKVAALAVAEEQLLQERTAHQGAEGRLHKSRPPSSTLGRPWRESALLVRWRRWLWRTRTPSSPRSRAS
jgi:chromosome segregation ATPase